MEIEVQKIETGDLLNTLEILKDRRRGFRVSDFKFMKFEFFPNVLKYKYTFYISAINKNMLQLFHPLYYIEK